MSKTKFIHRNYLIIVDEQYKFIGQTYSRDSKKTEKIDLGKVLNYYKSKNAKNGTYAKLCEKLADEPVVRHVVDNVAYESKDDANERFLEIQNKISDEFLLNDFRLDNRKVKCECGYMVKVQFLKEHLEKYCKKNTAIDKADLTTI